jgi:response regulator of citrate/malate metabolism
METKLIEKKAIIDHYMTVLPEKRQKYYQEFFSLIEAKQQEGAISKYRLIAFTIKVEAKILYEVGFTTYEIAKLLSISAPTASRYVKYDLKPSNILERAKCTIKHLKFLETCAQD